MVDQRRFTHHILTGVSRCTLIPPRWLACNHDGSVLILTRGRRLGQGSYYKVSRYAHNSGLYCVVREALEPGNEQTHDESGITHALRRCSAVIRQVSAGPNAYVVEQMDGHLGQMVDRWHMSHRTRLVVVEKIRRLLVTLYDRGYFYADIKPENILYTFDTRGELVIKMGDLGSMVADADGVLVATYPPPEGIVEHDRGFLSTEFCTNPVSIRGALSYYIGIIMVSVFGYPMGQFEYDRLDEYESFRGILPLFNNHLCIARKRVCVRRPLTLNRTLRRHGGCIV